MKNKMIFVAKSCLTFILGASSFIVVACKQSETQEKTPLNNDSASIEQPVEAIDTSTQDIAIPNTAEKTLEVYGFNSTSWDATTRKWQFKPTSDLGYTSGAIAALGDGIGDFRVHKTNGFPGNTTAAFVIQGGRYLGLGVYESANIGEKGKKLWEYTFPTNEDPNNHAVELLPNGNVAVAGYGDASANSTYGNWIRIYNTSDSTGMTFAETRLIGAHALLMDTVYNRLWAGGQILINGLAYHGIFAYIIGGTRTQPTITEDTSLRYVLRYGNPTIPTGAPDHLKWPHDLAPDYDTDSILYYGDHTGVYVFNKESKTLLPIPGDSHRYTGTDIQLKSVGKLASGYYVSTDAYNLSNQYMTNKVDFFDPTTGNLAFSRQVGGFTIYRARVWTTSYQ